MTDHQAELNAANKAYNLYWTASKDLNDDFEREMQIAEEYYGDKPYQLAEERNRIAQSKRYKQHVIKMGELIAAMKHCELMVKQNSIIVETQDPLWWGMLDDADKRNAHHMETKFSNFTDYGKEWKRK